MDVIRQPDRSIARIASTLFCSNGIDPSIVSFAKSRTATHWGLAEDQVDVLVAVHLLTCAARLITDLTEFDHEVPATGPVLAAA